MGATELLAVPLEEPNRGNQGLDVAKKMLCAAILLVLSETRCLPPD